MLQLKNIVKTYKTGDQEVQALKGVSINFRKSEFVSILGQSGCGKTTMLNIIGGLDQYTSGDLVINGKSTKKYKDSDWDTYRNHSIGFVFQSYNLIPHQTVLANVELALTLSGVSKKERRQRAIEALEKVGLGNQLHKRPSQMSGGQMQRVAIARAIVNDPDILLADEPTGALDSETSVQVMEILKEISSDRLIIMVTHNPELAEKYSTRIIKLFDGKVIDDSRPYDGEVDEDVNVARKNKGKKASMSFFTALALSANNLMTKKGRTFLTAFAGAIGIIGIAMILSLSDGFQTYIDKVQEDTLSTYPITINGESTDISALLQSMAGGSSADKSGEDLKDVVKAQDVTTGLYNALISKKTKNDLALFKKYLEDQTNGISDLTSAIKYSYDVNIKIYGTDLFGKRLRVNPSTVMDAMGMGNMMGMYSQMSAMPSRGSDMDVFTEIIDNRELLNNQYDVVAGRWPQDKSEVIFVMDRRNYVDDTAFYTLGLKDQSTLAAFTQGGTIDKSGKDYYSYEEIMALTFRVVLDSDHYYYNSFTKTWEAYDVKKDDFDKVVENGLELKIVGVVRPKEGVSATAIRGTVGYTKELTEYVIKETENSELVKKQKENKDVDVFTGKPFKTDDNEPTFDWNNLTEEQKAQLMALSEEERAALIKQMMEAAVSKATYDGNLKQLGVCDLSVPSAISIYPKDFESKDLLEDKIKEYNDKVTAEGNEGAKISYTDYIGIMMSSISTIINAITYVLIAFVGISLVVSSIMIAIITYISVLERTKEIGVLRSIGASKKDVSRVFNAETLIEGLISGLLGVGVTVILNFPVNMVIYHFSNLKDIAFLAPKYGAILIAISVLLTVIAGLIPAGMAAKRDPVEALRSE